MTETAQLVSQKLVSVVFRKGEGHGHGGRIVEPIEAFDRDENGFISADESRHVMTSLIEPHRGGETEFIKKASADASHNKSSDKNLLESCAKKRNGRARGIQCLSDMKTADIAPSSKGRLPNSKQLWSS